MSDFNNKKIAVTGKFNNLNRKDIELRLQALGATITKSVSSKTDILVVGEKAGSKLKKAQELNLQIINEDKLIVLFSEIRTATLEEVVQKENIKKEKATPLLDVEVATYLQQDVDKNGLTLASRLKLYFKLFQKRTKLPAIGEYSFHKIGKPVSITSLNRWKGKLPIDCLAFLSEMSKCTFELKPTKLSPKLIKEDYFTPETALALFNFEGIGRSPQWYPKPDYDEEFDYTASLMFDNMVAEGTAEYAYDSDTSKETANLVFVNHNSCSRSYMGSIENYLTDGAQNGFVWYWQDIDWTGESALAELLSKSISKDSPEQLILDRLEQQGCSKVEAKVLYQWLGKAVVILLPKEEFLTKKKSTKQDKGKISETIATIKETTNPNTFERYLAFFSHNAAIAEQGIKELEQESNDLVQKVELYFQLLLALFDKTSYKDLSIIIDQVQNNKLTKAQSQQLQTAEYLPNIPFVQELSFLNMATIPEEIGLVTNLKKLQISKGNLTKLPKSIGKLAQLEELDLSNNNIKILPRELSKLTALRKLNISHNKNLSILPTNISKLVNITHLNFVKTAIKQAPRTIASLKKLEEVRLSNQYYEVAEQLKKILPHVMVVSL